ncbi:PAS domain S-box protein [Methylobacterium sp. J-076]|uniref:PAS domain S-box protein n=1 Tax=Methylobacterium sp. J-076 TaxID=2836655 RepID=UPI0028C4785C|nr:PAS domain S-box protein [Methylobacterium sp. J-076]
MSASDDAVRDPVRLAALAAYDILDTQPEEGFDDIVQLATHLCQTPVALVSLVAADRQWFKARAGFPFCETELDSSVCAHVLNEPDLLVIPDLAADPRTGANPLVTGEPFIRFYAGAPLRTTEGQVIGSLCVIDTAPRPDGLTPAQAGDLKALARQVMSQLDLRRSVATRDALLADQAAIHQAREVLHRTQAAISEAGGDLDTILDILIVGAMQAVPEADGGTVELADGKDLEYRAVAGTLKAFRGRRVPLEGSLSGACFKARKPCLVPDVRVDVRVDQLLAERMRLRACITVPVFRGRTSIGVLKIQSSRPDVFTDRHLQVVRLFAGAASAGLVEAREVAAQRAAQATESRYRAVFESAIDYAIIVMDLDGTVTNWSGGAVRILGWTAEEIRGQSGEAIFTAEDRAAGIPGEEMRRTLTDGRAVDERWHLRKRGTPFWASGEMSALRDEAGTATGFVKILRDRTDEHLARNALADAEARLRQAQAAGGVGLFTIDLADNVLTPTPEFCRLYGLPERAGYPSTAFEALIIPEDAHLVSTARTRRQGAPPRDVEYRIRRPDTGEIRWIARKGEIEFDPSGRPVRFAGVARDITEQQTAREALARSEGRYRTLFDRIDEGFCVIRFIDGPHGPLSNYVHIEANPAFEHHLGIPHVEGQTLRDIASDFEAEDWLKRYGDVLRTGQPVRFDRMFALTGRHLEVAAHRIEPAARCEVAVLFTDITARKRAEAELRASEALARENVQRVQLALAAGAIIGTWFWDLPRDRFTVDEAFARAFGLDPAHGREGIPLAKIVETVHPDDQAGLAEAINDAITRGGAYAHQYRVRRADGLYYWLEANGRVDHAPDGTPLSFPGVLIDVDGRRAVEAERDRVSAELRALNETLEQRVADRTTELLVAEEQLRQAQKMEAVGQLTGGLAHDFNNLLAGISGSLELMQTRMGQGRFGDLDRYMTVAQGATKRAAALTHRLLAFSRRQTLDPKPTDVNRLVAGMEELVRRTIGPQVALEVVGAAGLWATLIDPGQLENALLNLCINARDAMPDGGRITIETANKWLDRPAATTHEIPEGQYLSLCVTDTGTGMPPEVIARVFEPFFTTKPIGEGTGLGLSMIYGFARQSGGQVRIYSEVGQGTTVCLYLPRYYGEANEDDDITRLSEVARAGQGETVLIVDDEPSVRMLVTEVLEDLGYTAIEAADSVAGLKVLQSDVRIDLLVTDVGLPGGMNGRQMADAGRERRPALKVLFITGYAENAFLGSGHLQPGMQVLSKPFAMEALASRIKDLIHSP